MSTTPPLFPGASLSPYELPQDWSCAICLSGKKWKVLSIAHNDSNGLKHPLHENCLRSWLKVKKTCPVCVSKVTASSTATFTKKSVSLVQKTKSRPRNPELPKRSTLWDYGADLIRIFTLTAIFSKMPLLGGIGCLASAALDSTYLGDKYQNYERSLSLEKKVQDLVKDIKDKDITRFKRNLRTTKEIFSPFDSKKEYCLTIRNILIKWSGLNGENILSSEEIQSEATSLEENVHKLAKDLLFLHDFQWTYIKAIQALGLWYLFDAAVSFLSPITEERV